MDISLVNWAKMMNKSGITIYFLKKINVLKMKVWYSNREQANICS